jgi:uncharacterized protein YfbU (UPF0304 family)
VDKVMELDKEEIADFKQMISMFVLLYKTIWDEVEKQFSELPQEEKHRVFSVIAPSMIEMFTMAGDESETETTNKRKQQKKRR